MRQLWSKQGALSKPPIFGLPLLGAAVATLFFVAWQNRDTPFRGEHWALLYTAVGTEAFFGRLAAVSEFVCFGVKRFQPLAFFPTYFSFVVFGTHFFLHVLLSVALQLLAAFFFLQILDALVRGREAGLRPNVFGLYPLEGALFLVAFPAADVLFWTFFHYIQWAVVLSLASTAIYLRVTGKRRLLAHVFACVATLIYEPFLVLVILFLAFDLWGRRQGKAIPAVQITLSLLFLACLVPVYGERFNGYLDEVSSHSVEQRQMVTAPLPTKVAYLAHKTSLLWANTLWSLSSSVGALKRHIYLFHTVPGARDDLREELTFYYLPESWLVLISLGFFGACGFLFFVLRRRRPIEFARWVTDAVLVGLLGLLPFAIIAWARPVVRSVSVAYEFRYAYVVLGYGLAWAFSAFYLLGAPSQRLYRAALAGLIVLNCSTLAQFGINLRADMQSLTHYVQELKTSEKDARGVVERVTESIAALNLPLPGERDAFIYNAQQCVAKSVIERNELRQASNEY